ncbi:MAG: hypothetical protein ACKKMV_03030 [Candidatus Nealsonbacteria bacterium]
MNKYKIQSNLLQNDKWQPAYLPPQGVDNIFSEPSEFIEERFNTKEEADSFALKYLIKVGVDKNNIEIL